MRRRKILVGVSLAGVLIAGGLAARYRMSRGAVGPSSAYGGQLEASAVPELPDAGPGRWLNGEPTTLGAHRGQPVLIEAWSPS